MKCRDVIVGDELPSRRGWIQSLRRGAGSLYRVLRLFSNPSEAAQAGEGRAVLHLRWARLALVEWLGKGWRPGLQRVLEARGWRMPGRRLRERRARNRAARQLSAFRQALARHTEGTEPGFVQVAETLRGLYSAARELAEMVGHRAEALRQALAESRLTGTEGLAESSLRGLLGALGETSRLLDSLRGLSGRLRCLQVQMGGICRIGMFLKASIFSFAIESARTAECQQAFGAFVEELRGLAARITSLGDAISREVQASQASQAGGLASMAASLGQMQQLADRLQITAQAAAAEAQKLLDASVEASRQAEERSRNNARQADDAVFYLQFGDIIRQKLEHIVSALEEAERRVSPPAPARDYAADAAAADGIISIQLGQFEVIGREIQAAHDKLAACFQGITDETGRLAAALDSGMDPATWSAGAADPLQALRSDFARMEQLYGEGSRLQNQARDTARQAADLSAGLARHVDQMRVINADMHLQSLNAIIKTTALGRQGTTLERLSTEVDNLYRQSNEVVGEVIGTLDGILAEATSTVASQNSDAASLTPDAIEQAVETTPRAGAAACVLECGTPVPLSVPLSRAKSARGLAHSRTQAPLAAVGNSTGCEGELGSGFERLALAWQDFRQASTPAAALVDRQRAALSRGRAALEFLSELGAGVKEQAERLASLRRTWAPWVAEAQAGAAVATEALRDHYTMQGEREIHERASQRASPQVSSAPAEKDGDAEPAAMPAATSLGDNVELF